VSGFAHRKLDVAFTLGTGAFGEAGTENTVTLTGLRVSASIVRPGNPGITAAQIRVYGMSLSDMNKLSTLGKPLIEDRLNYIALSAGVTGGGMSIVFQGVIRQAWADMNSAPQVPFIVQADNALARTLPIPATSYDGAVDVATVLAFLAAKLGMSLENNAVVSVILAKPYLHGSAHDQIKQVADAAGINYEYEGTKLAIWPKGGTRGGLVPLISPETGMIGYPSFTQQGIVLRTLYNPAVTFGATVQVKSDLVTACGTWISFNLTHDLESETPGGQWHTTMECYLFGHPVPVAR
jgi:hypothetical protein